MRDLLQVASRHHAIGLRLSNGGLIAAAFKIVVFFNQQPGGLFFVGRFAAHADQRPLAFHLFAMQHELQRTRLQRRVHVRADRLRLPRPLVPHHHCAAAVLPLRDDALEPAILHRMVFDLHGQSLIGRDVAGSFGNGPALEHAIPSQAEVVVKTRGRVLLNHEGKRLLLRFRRRFLCSFGRSLAAWLCCYLEVAHLLITRQLPIHSVRRRGPRFRGRFGFLHH